MGRQYRVIVADPPWRFGDPLPGNGRGAVKHYGCLDADALCAFPLPPLADDAILLLWRVSAMPEEALRVCRAWGFVPKSEIVWVKKTSTGARHFGMGRYVRAEHETCIVASRGRGSRVVRLHNIRSTFEAQVGRHSEKPESFYGMVETWLDGPYVELFARRKRHGWDCIGNEIGANLAHAPDRTEPSLSDAGSVPRLPRRQRAACR